jgi:rhamnose utilization protein RhaD (predicted bifunctional aldolase and dehydrogenase)
VKASGYRLSAVSEKEGYVYCDIKKVRDCYNTNEEQLENTMLERNEFKPSMETFFHLLPKSYIVHIHPIFFCKYLCKANAPSIFSQENFPQTLFIAYKKPGLELAKAITPKYNGEHVIFLENHGIILLEDSVEAIIHLYNKTLKQLEHISAELCNFSCILIEKRIKDITKLTVKPIYNLSFNLPNSFMPITPDHFLFLEESPLKTKESDLEASLLEWKSKKKTFPSVLQVDSQTYILGKSFHQCQNKEEYLQSYFEISSDSHSLLYKDMYELSSCSKESFRLDKI